MSISNVGFLGEASGYASWEQLNALVREVAPDLCWQIWVRGGVIEATAGDGGLGLTVCRSASDTYFSIRAGFGHPFVGIYQKVAGGFEDALRLGVAMLRELTAKQGGSPSE